MILSLLMFTVKKKKLSTSDIWQPPLDSYQLDRGCLFVYFSISNNPVHIFIDTFLLRCMWPNG